MKWLKIISVFTFFGTLLLWVVVQFADQSFHYDTCTDTQEVQYSFRKFQRGWRSFDQSVYCMNFVIGHADQNQSEKIRERTPYTYEDDQYVMWGNIYQKLYEEDHGKLTVLYDSLWKIRHEYQLGRNAFAEAIVSFVQDIDYSYILNYEKCSKKAKYGEPCVENVKFGVYSPVEFMYSLHGDCDTRTLFLYTVFKYFNYAPLILNSRQYTHSILALDISASGDYVIHKGKKFFFWETTAQGWQPGFLPPGCNDISKWHVVLD